MTQAEEDRIIQVALRLDKRAEWNAQQAKKWRTGGEEEHAERADERAQMCADIATQIRYAVLG